MFKGLNGRIMQHLNLREERNHRVKSHIKMLITIRKLVCLFTVCPCSRFGPSVARYRQLIPFSESDGFLLYSCIVASFVRCSWKRALCFSFGQTFDEAIKRRPPLLPFIIPQSILLSTSTKCDQPNVLVRLLFKQFLLVARHLIGTWNISHGFRLPEVCFSLGKVWKPSIKRKKISLFPRYGMIFVNLTDNFVSIGKSGSCGSLDTHHNHRTRQQLPNVQISAIVADPACLRNSRLPSTVERTRKGGSS